MHWFPRHGKSMDTFRADVAKVLMVSSGGGNEASGGETTPDANRIVAAMLDAGVEFDAKLWTEVLKGTQNPPTEYVPVLISRTMATYGGITAERLRRVLAGILNI